MNDTQKEKIKRFVADKVLSESVQDVLLKSFLKPRNGQDIQLLAASRIAIDLLDEGFRELRNIAREETKPEKRLTQPGL